MQPGVLSGGNLVYCAPTSGGKSAVAEILMMRRLITTGRTAMLVMPFVSLCEEKSIHLARLLKPLEKWVCPLVVSFHAFRAGHKESYGCYMLWPVDKSCKNDMCQEIKVLAKHSCYLTLEICIVLSHQFGVKSYLHASCWHES